MTCLKKCVWLLLAALLLAGLSGCSLFFGNDGQEADLVVYNDSVRVLGSAGICTATESQGVSNAGGCGLERGESWGFQLSGQAQDIVVRVYDQENRQLAQGRFRWPGSGGQVRAVYDGSPALCFQWEK